MRFALLGDHADGLDMARALEESGRHELAVYSGPPVGMEYLARWGLRPRPMGDLEEILADPAIDAVIVASSPALRAGQLRRALQSERHVLCVHPCDDSPDLAYEAGMLRGDTGCVLLPLLPESLHPAVRRLAELTRLEGKSLETSTAITAQAVAVATTPAPAPPPARLLEFERWSMEEFLAPAERAAGFPGWDLLRILGGEIAVIFALASLEEVDQRTPLLLSGQFVRGGLFQATLVPLQAENRLRLALLSSTGRTELLFPQGLPGPAQLAYRDEAGQQHLENWPAENPWPALVESFEAALGRARNRKDGSLTGSPPELSWQDEVRAVELDDATRRSVHRRRASTLDYIEATEEASFKGTMTLVGCSMLWLSLALLILSAWLPWLGWLILPLFGVFLLMQGLRLVLPGKKEAGTSGTR